MKAVVDVMRDIVSRVSTKVTPTIKAVDSAINNVHYETGHWIEICNKLVDMTKSVQDAKYKFPMIALLENIPITDKVATMQIWIFHYTNPNFDSAKRQAVNYDPILYPIRDQLLKEIGLSSYFMEKYTGVFDFDMTYIDSKFFGTESIGGNTGLLLNDYVDAIQLKDLKLTINTKKC